MVHITVSADDITDTISDMLPSRHEDIFFDAMADITRGKVSAA